ncbi:MAG: HEPN domain-containing protein, partial [Candidatus Bipolaricaulis sp.]|nr:HEPN domain-containing protein [Candidatus Bipolaricaulis sp.]
MDPRVENWLNSARYDLAAARDMLAAGRFVYTIFFSHLAVEKALKAKVQEETGKTPPRVHDLIVLLKRA